MAYTVENIYEISGRDNRVSVIYFKEASESYKLYGESLTVVFTYSANEREKLEKDFLTGNLQETVGKVKATYLLGEKLDKEIIEKISKEGLDTNDMETVYSGNPSQNLYHLEETRTIKEIKIPLIKQSKGGDFDWMYGFKKSQVIKGVGLTPHERDWYLAMRKFYEEEELYPEELAEMNNEQGVLKPSIEEKYLELKLEKQIITPEEDEKHTKLLFASSQENFKILKEEINSAGLSLEKLKQTNPGLFNYLLKGTYKYIPERLNVSGKRAIYLDFRGFFHVFLRHVKEFEIGVQSKGRAKFLWSPDNVIMVIQSVIESIDVVIQEHWEKYPEKRFSMYGDQALYFEGDYYTFHIEADGRLSTFHKSNKKIELVKAKD